MTNLVDVALPKWPMMATLGRRVTEEQAAEIIVRCSSLHMTCNDREWLYDVQQVFGIDDRPAFDATRWRAIQAIEEQLGTLPLSYLELSDRIMSSYVGGPHGWLHWDGRIGECGHNIGKWPRVDEVHREWQAIATAFPFLELRCQLFSGEGCEDDIKPLVEYVVANGIARVIKPRSTMTVYPRDFSHDIIMMRLNAHMRERGCTLDQLKAGIQLARRK